MSAEPACEGQRYTVEPNGVHGYYVADNEARSVPEEYEILLTTGGPALRIFGELNNYNQPETARLQVQDWGTPWTDARNISETDQADLLAYAGEFWFGE